jgi:hypothetical protein
VRVDGIGILKNLGEYWRLTYNGCGHVQEFPRLGLNDPEAVIRHIHRYFAQCLSCRLESRPRVEPTG